MERAVTAHLHPDRRLPRPFQGEDTDLLRRAPMEVVCFLFPGCDGRCRHCWSSDTFLGRPQSAAWHAWFWPQVDPARIRMLKLSGGEPLLSPHFKPILEIIRQHLPPEIPLVIYSSGRQLIATDGGTGGIAETVARVRQAGLVQPGNALHVSLDEFHGESWFTSVRRSTELPDHIALMRRIARNFVAAMEALYDATGGSFSGKLKVHVKEGRIGWHRDTVFGWLTDEQWNRWVEPSEGLFDTGRAAENGLGDLRLSRSTAKSLLLIPGATFSNAPTHRSAQAYAVPDTATSVFLNPATGTECGVGLIGWWSLIGRRYCGGTIDDVLYLIGRRAS